MTFIYIISKRVRYAIKKMLILCDVLYGKEQYWLVNVIKEEINIVMICAADDCLCSIQCHLVGIDRIRDFESLNS